MEKGVIIYKSKYGAAKKYANWLVEMTGFDCMEETKAKVDTLLPYEIIIWCGGIYASGIAGLSFLKKHMKKLYGRKILIFCVGASPYDENALNGIKAHNLKGDLQEIPLFYGRGMWDESRMTWGDRTLCGLLQKSVAKKDPSTYEPWMKALLCAAGQSCDWTDKKYLTPLMEYLR